jgi:uncharacterized protein (DUF58 family)
VRPRRGLKAALWAAILLFAVVILSGNLVITALIAPVLSLALYGLLLPNPRVKHIYRSGLPKMVWTGNKVEIELEVQVECGVGMVSVFESLPEEFELTNGGNYRVFWAWKAGTRRFTFSFVCRKRGIYDLAPTAWTSMHGLHLREESAGAADHAMSLLVLPKPSGLPYQRINREQAQLPPLGATLRKVGVAADDFRELRQYHVGDPLKSINWKATARRLATGSTIPVTNQYESEGRRVAWILVDGSQGMEVGNDFRNPLELCLHLGMGAARHYLKRGYRVGVYAFGSDAPMLYPDLGNKQLIRISGLLARVNPTESYDGLMGAVRDIRGSLVKDSPLCLVFTRLDLADPEPLKDGIRQLSISRAKSKRRPQPIVIGVNGYHCVQARDWYERNAQLLLYLSTRPLVKDLHARGAKVLEWQPAAPGESGHLVREPGR